MRTRWAILLTVILLGGALSAFAGPTIQIGDPNCNSWDAATYGPITNVFSNVFSFTSNSAGGGFFGFCNKTGEQWTTVDIKVLGSFPDPIACSSDIYQCDLTQIAGGWDMFFSNPKVLPSGSNPGGIGTDAIMTINLFSNCDPTKQTCTTGEWGAGVNFYGGTNQDAVITSPVPEPVSVLLLGSGLVGLLRLKRRQQ